MTIIQDRITKATRARRFQDGYEPDWVRKAETFNPPEAKLPSAEPDQPVEIGSLGEGDAFQIVGGAHGIVTGAPRNGLALVNVGVGNRYIAGTTLVIQSAPDSTAP
jgi:hypothetical protein